MSVQMPLNIAYIAAYLIRGGFDVEIWDFEVEEYSDSLLIKRVENTQPCIIGLSAFTSTVLCADRLAGVVKNNFPHIRIAVGGVHVSALPHQSLKEFESFDCVVVGEGERTFLEFCQNTRDGKPVDNIDGLLIRGKDDFTPRKPIEDLDELPFPARDLLNRKLYTGTVHKGFSRDYLNILEVFTARGCPYECIFCASNVTLGRKVRFRSISNICDEISEEIRKCKINHVTFLDDTLTLKPERIKKLCGYLKSNNLTWNATGTRVNTVTKELLQEMSECGCIGIAFGVESGSQRMLDLMKKGITLKQVRDAFKWAKEAKVRSIEADFIIGAHPDETVEDLELTRKLIKELKPDILSVAYITPYPKTEVSRLMKERNLIANSNDWGNFMLFSSKKPSWRTVNFSSDDLFNTQRRMLRNYYYTPGYILRKISKMKNLNEFFYWAKSAIDFAKISIFSSNRN